MRKLIDVLKENYNVEIVPTCWVGDEGVILEGDNPDTITYNCIVSEDGRVFENGYSHQFVRSYQIDEKMTNILMEKNGLFPFCEWTFGLELAVYWNGSNWNCVIVKDYEEYVLDYSDEY